MNILLIILSVLAGIIILLLLVAAISKKEFSIKKEIVINRPSPDVFNYVKLIRNQEEYSVWVMRDPNIKIVYAGTDGTVGFTSSWTSEDKNVGIGEQEIIKLTEWRSIEVEIRFKKPFEATNYARTVITPFHGGQQTALVNTFYGKQKFPMNLMNPFMEKFVGKDMQQNLLNIKTNLEKQ